MKVTLFGLGKGVNRSFHWFVLFVGFLKLYFISRKPCNLCVDTTWTGGSEQDSAGFLVNTVIQTSVSHCIHFIDLLDHVARKYNSLAKHECGNVFR